ncbi:MAG: hypothetical protein IGS03_16800 [Candidatus Sericytochromatia bacterium]|nr:hypothetical protein [Candidatus Sericytochromatia bacterium]
MTMNIQADNGKIIQTPSQAAQPEQLLGRAASVAVANHGQNTADGLAANQTRLLDGRVVTMRRAIGDDLINADRISGDSDIVRGFALAASCASIDGSPLPYETFRSMDLADCQAIAGLYHAVMGNSPYPTPRT